MNIIVPAFWPPPAFGVLPDWTPIHRAVPTATIAVLNISLDKLDPLSLTAEDFFNKTGWRDFAPALVQQAQQAGLEVLGYVPTDGSTAVNDWPLETRPPGTTEEEWAKKPYRTLAHVKKYVDLWYDWLGLELPSIGWLLSLPDSSPKDWIASCPTVVTFATRLLTEALTQNRRYLLRRRAATLQVQRRRPKFLPA